MKALVVIVLFLTASQSYAAQKCLIDGKTLYKSGPCTQGIAKPISGGTFTSMSLVFANGGASLPTVKR